MSNRPTDQAKAHFGMAQTEASFGVQAASKEVWENEYKTRMAMSMKAIAEGLDNLATGLRATYMMLEKIEQKQKMGP